MACTELWHFGNPQKPFPPRKFYPFPPKIGLALNRDHFLRICVPPQCVKTRNFVEGRERRVLKSGFDWEEEKPAGD